MSKYQRTDENSFIKIKEEINKLNKNKLFKKYEITISEAQTTNSAYVFFWEKNKPNYTLKFRFSDHRSESDDSDLNFSLTDFDKSFLEIKDYVKKNGWNVSKFKKNQKFIYEKIEYKYLEDSSFKDITAEKTIAKTIDAFELKSLMTSENRKLFRIENYTNEIKGLKKNQKIQTNLKIKDIKIYEKKYLYIVEYTQKVWLKKYILKYAKLV